MFGQLMKFMVQVPGGFTLHQICFRFPKDAKPLVDQFLKVISSLAPVPPEACSSQRHPICPKGAPGHGCGEAKANVWISCPSTGASTHYDLGYNVVLQLLLGNRDFGHPHRCSTLVAVLQHPVLQHPSSQSFGDHFTPSLQGYTQ